MASPASANAARSVTVVEGHPSRGWWSDVSAPIRYYPSSRSPTSRQEPLGTARVVRRSRSFSGVGIAGTSMFRPPLCTPDAGPRTPPTIQERRRPSVGCMGGTAASRRGPVRQRVMALFREPGRRTVALLTHSAWVGGSKRRRPPPSLERVFPRVASQRIARVRFCEACALHFVPSGELNLYGPPRQFSGPRKLRVVATESHATVTRRLQQLCARGLRSPHDQNGPDSDQVRARHGSSAGFMTKTDWSSNDPDAAASVVLGKSRTS